ncbi:nucleotidyl transferase AbiEii/AbiGii toxin family protein [uncultured Zoogloea sp.]|uniref:nucleotidyl transferase AbiEii/AbiGii toxin family protein n=1 Tax=uncultured Zoogloea sp. TaxID=160237 RepID=UPI00261ADF92|nr:nucleotidyl transferase AbiEii/AbiGii toxin family protein [uncultured Zoogloea sp.]
MAKRQLTATEAFDLRQALHVATLDALMASRRWEPGDLVFQGGTSLHLAHGSPRFSEDLDFLVNSALKLDSIGDAMQARLEGTTWLPGDTRLTVGKAKDGHNPHAFVVSIGGPDVIGAVRVKVEMWQTEETALSAVKAVVAPVKLARGPAAGMQTFVPTADLPEIYADKVFALAARPYLKPRDVFDLHWLGTHSGLRECSVDDLRVRLATYPNETPSAWLEKAFARRMELREAGDAIATDLKRWLPSSWPITGASAKEMTQTAVQAIEQGIDMMREIEAEHRDDYESPSP